MGNTVDLAGAWAGLWAKITAAAGIGDLVVFITWIGVGLVAFAIIKWAWTRRKGGASVGSVGWPLIVGAVLAAPNAVLPAILWLVDLLGNAVVNIFG